MTYTRKVVVNQPVDYRVAAMVNFVKKLQAQGIIQFPKPITDEELVESACDFYDSQHGED